MIEGAALLTLLLVVNGSPVVARALLGTRLTQPLDAGRHLADGYRLLGPSKTWVGVLTAMTTGGLLAPWLGHTWQTGVAIGVLAMAGDAISSFIKRRRGLPAGAMALGLDQVPESLLPLVVLKTTLALTWGGIAMLTLAFVLADLGISRLLYRLGIPHHPH